MAHRRADIQDVVPSRSERGAGHRHLVLAMLGGTRPGSRPRISVLTDGDVRFLAGGFAGYGRCKPRTDG